MGWNGFPAQASSRNSWDRLHGAPKDLGWGVTDDPDWRGAREGRTWDCLRGSCSE
jgi:hypothetical protein